MSGFDWWEKKGSKKVLSFIHDGAARNARGQNPSDPYLSYNLPDILNPLRLSLPTHEDLPTTRKAPSPEDIETWLDGHSPESIRNLGPELQGLLRGINLHHVMAKRHLNLLILLQPHVNSAIAHLRGKYRTYPLPLEKKQAANATLTQLLLKEMAVGYKLVVNDVMCDLAEKSLDRNLFLFALQQAIVYLGQQVLEAYIQYQPDPEGVWGELHRLYQFAERNDFTTTAINSQLADAAPSGGTLQQAYMRVVLLALTQPNHLLSGQAEMIYHHLEQWTEAVQISDRLGHQMRPGDTLVDLASELPPRIVSAYTRSHPLEGRYLDIGGLKTQVEALRNNIDQITAQSDALPLIERIQRDTLNRLCDAWDGRGERRSERIPDGKTPVLTGIGLEAAHHFISGEKPFNPDDEETRIALSRRARAQPERRPVAPDADAAAHSARPTPGGFVSGGEAWLTLLGDPLAQRRRQQHTQAGFPIEAWRRINHSLGGLGLLRQSNQRGQLYVGSLVAFRDDKGHQAWRVGVIRWLQNQLPQELKIGIEALADDGRAVAVRAAEDGAEGYFRALLIRPLQHSAVEQALALPANIFESGLSLLLNDDGHITRVQLREIIDTTSSFSLFAFERKD